MPRNPKGEMTVSEIRNLARQHNKASEIKGIDKMSRNNLIAEIKKMGYGVNHLKKSIVKLPSKKAISYKQSDTANPKPNKTTRKKKARKELVMGSSVPLVGGDEV